MQHSHFLIYLARLLLLNVQAYNLVICQCSELAFMHIDDYMCILNY
ncbi:Ms [Siniperca chuatsi rhabdovirus]|uniref:Ms n=1 Tax=Siniperca chuatsi rhabdovirus TaxID=373862 RepID=Q06Z37_SCRV|nr:Ms [Siniperca chuatsi rhabdovirus]ABG76846.1 Ms [Siniperca chuatsi rhabdovirus]